MMAAILDANGLYPASFCSVVLELVRNKLIQAGKTAGAGAIYDYNANTRKSLHLSVLR